MLKIIHSCYTTVKYILVKVTVPNKMKIKVLIDSVYIKASGLISVIGFLLHLIGYTTQYWFKGMFKTNEFIGFSFEGHSGLWRGCDSSDTFCFTPTGGNSGKHFFTIYRLKYKAERAKKALIPYVGNDGQDPHSLIQVVALWQNQLFLNRV